MTLKHPKLVWKLLAINCLALAIVLAAVWLSVHLLAAKYFMTLVEEYEISPSAAHAMFVEAVDRYLLVASVIGFFAAALLSLWLSFRQTRPISQIDLKMPRQGSGLSRPRLRLAWCQASSSDFRWSMSQNELTWHAWCINMNSLCRLQPDGWAETMFGGDLDGLLVICQNRQLAIFDWQSNKQAMGEYIRFKDSSAEPDLEWVRCVCRSIRVCEVP